MLWPRRFGAFVSTKIKSASLSLLVHLRLAWLRRSPECRQAVELISRSGLFDAEYYLQHNSDVRTLRLPPLVHYVVWGSGGGRHPTNEKRNPHPLFDSSFYLERYPDVAQSGVNPLVHYLRQGQSEGHIPHPLFDSQYYLMRYPDVAAAGYNPLAHYMESGACAQRDPHPLFDAAFYIAQLPANLRPGVNPLLHYVTTGGQGLNPHPLFDTRFYLEQQPDLAGMTPLEHYLRRGGWEGKDPHPLFHSAYYLQEYADVQQAYVNPLVHYVKHGWREGRRTNPCFDSGYYLRSHPDVAIAKVNPLIHFCESGAREGRNPHPTFDIRLYREHYPDLAASDTNPLVHYFQRFQPLKTLPLKLPRVEVLHRSVTQPVAVNLLLDLSNMVLDRASIGNVIEHLSNRNGLGAITASARCILPRGIREAPAAPSEWQFETAENALSFSSCALEAAGYAGQPLLVLLGPALAGSESISKLLEALESDPMFGFAIGRSANEKGELSKVHAALGDPEIEWFSESVLAGLPDIYIVPEVVGACFVVRGEVTANIGALEPSFATTVGAWLQYLCRARRLGFRGAIVNRAVIPFSAATITATTLSPITDDYWKLHSQYSDTHYARQEFYRLSAHEQESLLARAFSAEERKRKTLLLDARGMPPYYNGTTTCILGLLDGFAAIAPDWQIGVLIKPEAKTFHQLPERYASWRIFENLPAQRFSMALRLSQPWDVQDLLDLHSRALCNFYVMLDTISWDILYNRSVPEALEATWGFMSEYADGILYISDYSRQRYAARFPPSVAVRQYVSYLSFHGEDYRQPDLQRSDESGYLLVVGNDLDHKWVAPTVELLGNALPLQSIYALGCGNAKLPNVTSIPSGKISQEELGRIFADARIIVFPSFYEGFGFPVLQGLSYGKQVLVRRSSLVHEVADRCRAEGRLYEFSNAAELLEIVTHLLRGHEPGSLPLGKALAETEEPMRWPDIARNMLNFMEAGCQTPAALQWPRRMQAIRLHHGWK